MKVFATCGLFAAILSARAFAGQEPTQSLFYQPASAIAREGNFACRSRELGRAVADVRALCGAPVADWKRYAEGLLRLAPEDESDGSQFGNLREVVARNVRISEAYAQLYLRSKESFPACGHSLLPWVGGAALGSLKSGQVMRSGLSAAVGEIPNFDRLRDANYRPRFAALFGPLGSFALAGATLALGDGNRAIFADLYWQLLAGATCGPEQVIATIHAEPRWQEDKKLTRSLRSWELLARAAQDCDEEKVVRANQGFVEVEQYLVGQRAMYEGLARAFGGWVLSPLIEAALPSALGSFPNFLEHARQDTPPFEVSFANADQRVRWMKDQLAVMQRKFRAHDELVEPLFCALASDSERATRTLNGLGARMSLVAY